MCFVGCLENDPVVRYILEVRDSLYKARTTVYGG
jgi:hypothetical protein